MCHMKPSSERPAESWKPWTRFYSITADKSSLLPLKTVTRQSIEKKDSISVESQLEYCRYETHGESCIEYTDRGFSGKDTNRPGFENMMNDIRAGKIKRVIVYKLDRISRSILDFANMMEIFQKYHVEFVSSTEKFDTSTPIGRAMLNICIVFAQLERETTIRKAKTKWGRYFVCSQSGSRGSNCTDTGCTVYADVLEEYMLGAIKERLGVLMKYIGNIEITWNI